MQTFVVICGGIFFVAWGVQHVRHPESLRANFNDAYLKKEWYLMFVRLMGVVSIFAGLTLLGAYFNPF